MIYRQKQQQLQHPRQHVSAILVKNSFNIWNSLVHMSKGNSTANTKAWIGKHSTLSPITVI